MNSNNKMALWLLDYGIILILVMLIAVFSIASSNFFSFSTVTTILRQLSALFRWGQLMLF